MKRMKNMVIKSCLFSILLIFSSCNSWLDIKPIGVQTSDTYWETKEQVEQVLTSTYIQLRTCVSSFFKWGELRSGTLEFGRVHSILDDPLSEDERSLRELDIRPSNVLTQWSSVYVTIGRANSVFEFAPLALETDPTFAPTLCHSYMAEAVFIRSLCYFYLVRTFRDVPYVTEPFSDDSRTFLDSITQGTDILNNIIKDLEEWAPKCKPGYEEAWQTKGRATSWAFYALMADIYLWQGNYSGVSLMYQRLKDGGFSLVETDDYWEIFYPGNSLEESIFELQFRDGDNMPGQGSGLYNIFQAGHSDGRYIISDDSRDLIDGGDELKEIRGQDYMYEYLHSGKKYFKYIGTESRFGLGIDVLANMRPINDQEPNWIFYRFADIVLMEAEAMTMSGVSNIEVCKFLDETIRRRAGLTKKLSPPMTELGMLELILDERLKEFVAEGKYWFDLLRMARRDDYKYRNLVIDELCRTIPAKDRDMWRLKLLDEYGHYLPINKGEIEASYGTLPQNPFYRNIE